MNTISEEILSRKEAAIYLGICLTTLDRSSIPRAKIGKRILFKKSVLNLWLEQQMRMSNPA
jgi:hypothetical protein